MKMKVKIVFECDNVKCTVEHENVTRIMYNQTIDNGYLEIYISNKHGNTVVHSYPNVIEFEMKKMEEK